MLRGPMGPLALVRQEVPATTRRRVNMLSLRRFISPFISGPPIVPTETTQSTIVPPMVPMFQGPPGLQRRCMVDQVNTRWSAAAFAEEPYWLVHQPMRGYAGVQRNRSNTPNVSPSVLNLIRRSQLANQLGASGIWGTSATKG